MGCDGSGCECKHITGAATRDAEHVCAEWTAATMAGGTAGAIIFGRGICGGGDWGEEGRGDARRDEEAIITV